MGRKLTTLVARCVPRVKPPAVFRVLPYAVGDCVWARAYAHGRQRWLAGRIVACLG